MFYCNFETFEFHSDFLVFCTQPCRSSFYLIYYAFFLSGSPVIFIQNSFIRWFVVRYATRCPVKLQLQLISVAFGFSITDLCHKMPCKTAISAHICGIWFGRTCRAALPGLLYLREPDAGEAFSAGALAMTSEMTVESG